jgi:periplasmic protein TonB
MFESAMIPAGGGNQRIFATGMGIAGQTLVMAAAVAIPLLFPSALPKMEVLSTWLEAPPLRRPEPVRTQLAEYRPHTPPLQVHDGMIYEPVNTPTNVPLIEDPPAVDGAVTGYVHENVERLGQFIGRPAYRDVVVPPPVAAVEPKPVAPPVETPTKRVRQGGVIVAAEPIRRVEPAYPEIAIRTRVSGQVELEGVIGTDGRVHELRAVSGSPLLVRAALDAVKQWVYKPLLLNGEAVEVVQSIVVTFKLK